MSQETIATESVQRTRIEPYWYLIALFFFGGLAVFIYHLVTKNTPNNVAIHIPLINFDVFWYGLIIVSGIALGSYVTSRLALDRAVSVFDQYVPLDLQQKPVSELKLRKVILEVLEKRKIEDTGELLFQWGMNPDRTGLNRAGQTDVKKSLVKLAGVEKIWLEDAPWRQWNPDYVWGGVIWCLILAVVGARIYHILTPSPSAQETLASYLSSPQKMLDLRNGGLGIYGGIAGGFIGLLIYTRRNHISAIAWGDLAVIGLALGQFVGRWANFINQELYGSITELPWGLYITRRLPSFPIDEFPFEATRFHPAFLYQSLWNLMIFFVLIFLEKRYRDKLQRGDLIATYLVLFALGRILMEFVRLDSLTLSLAGIDLGLPVATVVSILIAIPLAALLLWRHVIPHNR
jgi:phosphatidylglycerol:prolipoprotein diacylglycerol transferase